MSEILTYAGVDKHGNNRTGVAEGPAAELVQRLLSQGWRWVRVADRDDTEVARAGEPWEADDGSRWLYFPQFREWHGWMPGEDGLWVQTIQDMDRFYPQHPMWDNADR